MSCPAHDELTKLSEACVDDAEVLAVSVLRFIAAGYMTSDTACWDAAHRGAELVLGPVEGPLFVARMVAVMRAIRAERPADWHFLPATCCRVTEDERGLIHLLSLARAQGRRQEEIAATAARFVGAPDAPRLRIAARLAAQALDEVQPKLMDGQRPHDLVPRSALH